MPAERPVKDWPGVDIIICTFNRAALLGRLLEALRNQDLPLESFRIVVVDDGSTDGTQELCTAQASSLPSLVYERCATNRGLSAARNLGLSLSTAPLALFTDDDCIPRPDWIREMVRALQAHPIVAGAIESPDECFWQLCHNIAEFHPFLPTRNARLVRFLPGANMGLRREALNDLAGFESGRTMAEDMELALRAGTLGWNIHFTPSAVVLHTPPRSSLWEILEYSAHHARSTILLRRAYRSYLGIPSFVLSVPFLLLFSPAIAALTTLKIFFRDAGLRQRRLGTLPIVYLTKLAWCIGACQGLLARNEV